MQRRLPVFFLLDVSESMAGEGLYQMEEAFRSIVGTLRRDPHCLETVYLSVIAFAGKPRTLVSLTNLVDFVAPELPIGGGTALGSALAHLMSAIDQDVRDPSMEVKGDWKPVVFLITDGHPTDAPSAQVERWRRDFGRRADLVAVSVGGRADSRVLSHLTDNVVVLDDSGPEAFAAFVRWVSQSVRSQSRSVTLGKAEALSLAPFDDDFVREFSELEARFAMPDTRFVVVIGRCEHSRRPYLVKYRHVADLASRLELPPEARHIDHVLVAGVPLHESYFEMSEDDASTNSIDLGRVLGAPPCPHCGAEFSLAVHSRCGNAHCVSGAGVHVCPWCGDTSVYESAEEGESLEVRRGQG